MIDELQREAFQPKTLSDIGNYFQNKEIEAKRKEEIAILEAKQLEIERRKREEGERIAKEKKQIAELQKAEFEEQLQIQLQETLSNNKVYQFFNKLSFWLFLCGSIIIIPVSCFFVYQNSGGFNNYGITESILFIVLFIFEGAMIGLLFYCLIQGCILHPIKEKTKQRLMKKNEINNMKQVYIILIALLLLSSNVYAEELNRTIHVESAGTLLNELGNQVNKVTSLTLTGYINGTDIKTIRKMVQLSVLNMENANIVEGGDTYYEDYKSENNVIGDYTFKNNKNLTSVIIPQAITRVGTEAFYNCSNLISIGLGNSLITIERDAFWRCSSLTDVVIPNTTTNIASAVFGYCTSLTDITIPDSVIKMGKDVFYKCSNLTSTVLSNSLIEIDEATFFDCINLTSVHIGNSVKKIDEDAFFNCRSLTSVIIPASIENIYYSSFAYCASLESILIPSTTTSIKISAFYGCSSLKSIIVDEDNEYYSSNEGILYNKDKSILLICPEGKHGNMTIPDFVKVIDAFAFENCSINSVIIGNSVTKICDGAFFDCKQLHSVSFEVGEDTLLLESSLSFQNDRWFKNCPIEVLYIGRNFNYNPSFPPFKNSTEIILLTINLIENIGEEAFYNCKKLQSIYCLNLIPPIIDINSFNPNIFDSCRLFVPTESFVTYWSAPIWENFKNIIEIDVTNINNSITDDILINTGKGYINIKAKELSLVSIYSISSKLVYRDVIEGSIQIPVASGVYIINSGKENHKVMVK